MRRESSRLPEFSEIVVDYAGCGHTHYAFQHRIDRTLVISPGSAGQPCDPRNGFRSSYAVLDTQSGEVGKVGSDVYAEPAYRPQQMSG